MILFDLFSGWVFPENDADVMSHSGRKLQLSVLYRNPTYDLYNSIKLTTATIRITSDSLVEQRGIVMD